LFFEIKLRDHENNFIYFLNFSPPFYILAFCLLYLGMEMGRGGDEFYIPHPHTRFHSFKTRLGPAVRTVNRWVGRFEPTFGSVMQLTRPEPVKTGDSTEFLVWPVLYFFYFFFAFSFTKTTSFWIFQLKKKKKLELERSKNGRKTPKPHSLHSLLCFHVFFKLLLLLMTIIII